MTLLENPVYDKYATLSADGVYRYRLGRVWEYGKPTLYVVMLNPSSADAERDDPTIQRLVGFADRNGYGALHVINLYGLRSSHPADLKVAADPVGELNDAAWAQVLASIERGRAGDLLVAWGNHAEPSRADEFLERCRAYHVKPLCLGRTGSGAPIHPLARGRSRVPDDAPFVPYYQ